MRFLRPPGRPLDFLTMELARNIRQTLTRGSEPAFELETGWFTWGEVAAVAEALQAALDGMGIGPSTPIGLVGRNRAWTASALLGILAGERCQVPLNPFQSAERLRQDIRAVPLAAVVAEPEDYASGELEALARELGIGAIVLGEDGPLSVRVVAVHTLAEVPSSGPNAFLMPTSGTTGVPKRIPIRFDSLYEAHVENAVVGIAFGEEDLPPPQQSPLIQYSPMVHITGSLAVSRCGCDGRRLVLLEKFTPEAWVAAIRRHRHPAAGLPPTMMRMVLDLDPDPRDLSSLVGVWSGSSPMDRDVVRRFEERYGATVMGSYGATEYCGIIACGSLADRARFGKAKDGAVGRFRRHVADARVTDPETGEELPPGSTGVLEVRVHRMGPEWMRTSDLVSIDEDDFLYVHGRADDAINRGGFKIVPSVIADALKRHPQVGDVAVVGLPHERLGEAPVAVVEMKPGEPMLSPEELLQFARRELVAYQVPTAIKVVRELPRTPSMKIDRMGVKALF